MSCGGVAAGTALSWLDGDPAQRQQMVDMLDAFGEKTALDELGFGMVRDAFADAPFPATSSQHARVRYLLFVPWMFCAIAAGRKLAARASRDPRTAKEVLAGVNKDLADALQRGSVGDGGIIGRRSGTVLQLLPSSIYWTTTIRPLSTPQALARTVATRTVPTGPDATAQDGAVTEAPGRALTWTVSDYARVTPWPVATIEAHAEHARVRLTRIVKADLDLTVNLSADREGHLMRAVLSDPSCIMAYLSMLIAGQEEDWTDHADALVNGGATADLAEPGDATTPQTPPLLESLLHLADADPAQLARVGRDLEALVGEHPPTPELQQLRDLWRSRSQPQMPLPRRDHSCLNPRRRSTGLVDVLPAALATSKLATWSRGPSFSHLSWTVLVCH